MGHLEHGAGQDRGIPRCRRRHGADPSAVRVPEEGCLQGQRQHRRRNELHLPVKEETITVKRMVVLKPGLTLASLLVLAACGGGDGSTPTTTAGPVAAIKVLSNRADVISGGDALIEVVAPAGTDVTKLKVESNGTDVTNAFAVRADGRYYGLVTGLTVGSNAVRVAESGKSGATLTITNYPKGGPVISGAQIKPWTCTTKVATPSATNPDLGDP